MKVAVIGTGYVGLVAGACLADVGNNVICVDKDESKVVGLREGRIPIYEPGLDALVLRNHKDGRLSFSTETPSAVRNSEIIFIAVGTPPGEDGSADLSHVLAVARVVGDNIDTDDKIIICKSTVPVGTCDIVRDTIAERTDHTFHVVSNPEFLKEGAALKDFLSPDRVIIGAASDFAAKKVGKLYKPFMRRDERILYMDVRSAEMTKYASNAMLATKISFINEIANVCDAVGADVERVRRGMAMDERIGPHFIYPGVGYGGSCFPKDVRALAKLGEAAGANVRLLHAVEEVNNDQKLRLVDLATGFYRGDLRGKHFAVWGLSFKPRTDDVREAPSLLAIRRLLEAGATVRATDPVALETAQEDLADLGDLAEQITFCENDYDALEGADALFVFTEWNEFRSPDFDRVKSELTEPVIFDGRNIYDPVELTERGFTYFSIGRNVLSRQ